MPTIKVSEKTMQRMQSLMAERLRERMQDATGKEKSKLFLQLIKSRYGLTYDTFISGLLDQVTK